MQLPEHDSCLETAMRERDFFAYCTTLKLLELKAIGELSRVVLEMTQIHELVLQLGHPIRRESALGCGEIESVHCRVDRGVAPAPVARQLLA